MPELIGMIFPRMGNKKGPQEPGAFRAAGAVGIGSQGMARLRSKAMQNPPPRHLEAPGRGPGGCRPPATHCEPVTLHHFIKLLINLFIFLFRLRGQRKHFIPFRALALPVLLVQRLLRLGGHGGVGEGAGDEVGGKSNRRETKQKRTYNEGFPATGRYLHRIA